MKRFVLSYLALILILTLITPVYSSVELKATISQDIHVIFNFQNVTSYEAIKGQINEFTIPDIIRGTLEERNLTDVEFLGESVYSDDTEKSIRVGFYLSGSDILEFTFSAETMRRTCRVRTDWRKFELNLTNDFSLNFTEYFGKPISISPPWQLINYTDLENRTYPAYYCDYTSSSSVDPECYFILPREATKFHVEGETIVFELPPSLGESLINSPFLILGAIIVAVIVASLYQTMMKSEEQGLES